VIPCRHRQKYSFGILGTKFPQRVAHGKAAEVGARLGDDLSDDGSNVVWRISHDIAK
jgi:hypothetical protein